MALVTNYKMAVLVRSTKEVLRLSILVPW